MRRRLAASYLLLMTLVLLALEIPLAVTLASRESDLVRADRLADATRFAALARPGLRTDSIGTVRDELTRYDELYGIGAAVLDRDKQTFTSSASYRLDPARRDAAMRAAVAGQQYSSTESVLPWSAEPIVVAVPVNDNGEVLGMVVIVSPSGRVRDTVAFWWLALGGIGLLAALAAVLTARSLANWVLRPVTVLDAMTHEVAAGDSGTRIADRAGPPELRRLTRSFNDMAYAVADAMERQRAFVAHASHQLRNPLTALRLRVEELGPSLADEDGRAEHRLALEETDRLATVLDGLLTLARAERGRHRLITVDAVTVAQARVAAWKPLARHTGTTLTLRAASAVVLMQAVPTALDQALDALIDNAVKFSGPGGKVEVEVGPADGGGVAVHVRDDGPGMTDEQLGQATERFWRAPHAQNIDGSGLGLTIVAVLVDASGGRLTMSRVGERGLDARVWFRDHDAAP
ncbi:HAMP domain-containing sensor histidine kinase [Catellatospora sp. NPDC049609]|uniref:sensor histidine kinase n=1 Tax=Catellatospora sp. NPDC049609 TaxID=3155505 RepID=UPI00341A058E